MPLRHCLGWCVNLFEFIDRPFDRIYCSPMVRVRQTAEPLLDALGQAAVVIDDLREVDFGVWTGYKWYEIEEKFGKPIRTGGEGYTRKYDEKGNPVEEVKHDASGKILDKVTNKYDEKRNIVKKTFYELKTVSDETRFIPDQGWTWELTYWD